jgi:hypothetical protein
MAKHALSCLYKNLRQRGATLLGFLHSPSAQKKTCANEMGNPGFNHTRAAENRRIARG